MKKQICILLAFSMMLGFGVSNFTSKAAGSEKEGIYIGNTYVTGEAVKCIEETGINIEDCDHIELIESIETKRSMPVTALRVTEKESEDIVVDHIIAAYEEDEEGNVEAANVPFEVENRARNYTIDWTPGNSLIIVTGTIRYNVYGNVSQVYIQPEAVEFYMKDPILCQINIKSIIWGMKQEYTCIWKQL